MQEFLEVFRQHWLAHSKEKLKPILMEQIWVGNNAIQQLLPFLQEKNMKHILVVVDNNTFQAAGKAITEQLMEGKYQVHTCLMKENEQGDLIADESSIVQLLLETPQEVDLLIAIGAGTLHDIVRFVSYKLHKPFISVPTAASVDGFTSAGAPLIINGMKSTYQTTSPMAVFADLNILATAPQSMNAAGFADMLGKFTSLADWHFSSWFADEPFSPLAAKITEDALGSCVKNIEEIAKGTREGLEILIKALIQSGLAMLLVDHSRPASGAEHHLSHFWEMHFLQEKRPQVLHGAKVGVATAIISSLYHKAAHISIDLLKGLPHNIHNQRILARWSDVQQLISNIPHAQEMKEMLDKVGGPSSIEQLAIESKLAEQALREAHHIRPRYTCLRWINENKLSARL